MSYKIDRKTYAQTYGPTTGDRVRLADTELFIEVEKDLTTYGDEVKFGGGKVIRDGMGQSQVSRKEGAVDTVITNALIVDINGIYKADIGIKDGLINEIGKAGNPDTHIVLRGGSKGPNFGSEHVRRISSDLKQSNLPHKVMIDCSHGHSNKDFRKQSVVLKNIASQISNGEKNILGVMLESHLKEGNQKLKKKEHLEFGRSITDACIDIETTKELLAILYNSIS